MKFCIACALLTAGLLIAQTPEPANPSLRFSIDNMDLKADPCVDFYQYACGTWMAKNPIPPDESRWGRFDQLQQRNEQILRSILEKASVNDPKRDALDQKIGDFYASCMDEAGIEKAGLKPLDPELQRIATVHDRNALVTEIARLQRIGVGVFFEFGSGPDFKNSTMEIAQVAQGGLGLPDRDYYTRTDQNSVELRAKYLAHVAKMFELLGEPATRAQTDAAAVMAIETDLAKASLDRVSRRDPQKVYHKLPSGDLAEMTPFIEWNSYLTDVGAPKFTSLNVEWPDFFKALQTTLTSHNIEDLKTYMRWHLVHSAAPLLPTAFVNENFNFYGTILRGAKQLRPRWRRCVEFADNELGQGPLGQKYVEQNFSPQDKSRTLKMVGEIEKALHGDIETLSWMSADTKKEAEVKLAAVTNKIGYPDKWRDYSSVQVVRGDALGNDQRLTEFEVERDIHKIGQPVDPKEWVMTPPTVNAYYDPTENNINFPAGILQPPFYDSNMDDAVNYGAIGAVIGHELTHGFDDQGRQFGPHGNLMDWWTPQDAKEFEQRADCFVKEYESFSPIPGVHLNGKLTLGENTADNGGLRLAFMALMDAIKDNNAPKIDNFTPEQRMFIAFGQVWCQNTRPEYERLMAQTNPHSPGKFRADGVVQNMPEFRQAFSCKVGQPMVREPACRVW